MQKHSMTCTCGEVFTVDAATKEEAVEKMKAMMTPDVLKAHWDAKHVGQPMPSAEELEKMFQTVAPAA